MHGKLNPKLTKLIISRKELEKTALDKIPSLFHSGGLFDKRSLEQCTSEQVADYKASLFKGRDALVLAGGLGVDEMAFSRHFDQIFSIELNDELNEVSQFNFNSLGITNINRIGADAENYIATIDKTFDFIYMDPDRRDESKRQFLLKDHSPNAVNILSRALEISPLVAIKASPLYDYAMAMRELKHVDALYAISRNGEMKELLILCRRDAHPERARIICVDIHTSIRSDEFPIESMGVPEKRDLNFRYFFEAGASLVKMRKHHDYAFKNTLSLIDAEVPYYLSDSILDSPFGRQFELVNSFKFSQKTLRKYLRDQSIDRINLKVRGLNFNTSELNKSLRLDEGGEEYVFVLPYESEAFAFHCRKIRR